MSGMLKISRRKFIAAAPAVLIPRRGWAAKNGLASSSNGLKINLVYDTNWSGAPTSYQTAVVQAANLMMAAFPNSNATVNVEMGFGFLANQLAVGPNTSASTDLGTVALSYSAIRAGMVATNHSSAMTTQLANTPAGSTLNGQGLFNAPFACCKVLGGLGGISPTATALDGAVGIGSGFATGELIGVFLHEISQAMGREATGSIAPYCFSRFTAVGVRDFSSATNAYFSLDGGNTSIAGYAATSDVGDFINGGVQDGNTGSGWQSFPSDCFDAFQGSLSIQSLTTADTQIMSAMGF